MLTSAWLKRQGISSRLADYYARSGWLHRVGDGAFTVQPEPPSWLGAVFGLQEKSKSFHPGGRTALELSGLAHFLPLGDNHPVYLSAARASGSPLGSGDCPPPAASATSARTFFRRTRAGANTAKGRLA